MVARPAGSCTIGNKAPGNPGKGPPILTWANSGIGGQCDIGNNKTA